MPRPSDLVPSGFFVLRTPLLPFDELLRWADDLEAPDAPDDADALDRDRRVLRARLRDFVTRPEVREAIFVASPGVHDLVDGWIANPDSERSRQCERALVRYFCRMTGRSTPFGLFAGVSTGRIGDAIKSSFGDFEKFKTQMNDAGVKRFGSGWAWLIDAGGKLVIESTANQDSPLMEGKKPLLGIDVWEHAYYLKYQNRRPDYLAAWWSVVNWDAVNKRF